MSRATFILLLALGAGACHREPAGSISRDKFVRVNVALRLVPDTAPDARARRDSILRRERTTPGQLEQWVRAHAGSDTLVAAWRDIAARLDSAQPPPREEPAVPGAVVPPPPGEAAPGATPAAEVPPPPGPGSRGEALRQARVAKPPPHPDSAGAAPPRD